MSFTLDDMDRIIRETGKSVNLIEKELGIGQGVIGKVRRGKRKLPKKYEKEFLDMEKMIKYYVSKAL